MRRYSLLLIFACLLLSAPRLVLGQSAPELMEAGREAFRAERYAEAARAFERAAEADPANAEAFFLLARIYAETPLADEKKADKALSRALDLEPDNVQFLVARLQRLRAESWNFFTERIRETKRIDLAKHILELDSTNAFAHEELGSTYIRDFWRFRNAIMMPTLRFASSTMLARTDEAHLTTSGTPSDQPPLDPNDDQGGSQANTGTFQQSPYFDPNAVFQADRFDVERLKEQGVPVQDLSRRAQHAYERAIEHLEQALATDPRRRSVYDRMMEIYALKGEYAAALEMLEEMHAFFPEDAATWLYLGMTHHRLGTLDAAHKSFETAFRYMEPEEREAFASLDHLLPADARKAYEEDPVAYASRFWTSKDPRYLTVYNERKLEHYARLVYADLMYGAEDVGLRGWDTQRGRILVRYGLPASDVVLVPQNTSMSASDVIGRSMAGSGGRRPAEEQASVTDPLAYQREVLARDGSGFDIAAEANTYNIWNYGDFRFVFEDPLRTGEYRLYSPSATEISSGVHPWLNDYVLRAEETFKKVPDLYEYEAPGRQVEMPFQVNTFRGEEGNADVYVHYGIPITQRPEGSVIDLTAHVGSFLVGEERDLLAERRRTIYGLRTSQILSFKDASLWVDTQSMQAPPGKHQVSMEFETASGGTVAVQRRSVDVPDYTTDRLALSDVMLAYRVEEDFGSQPGDDEAVRRRGLAITPAPWSVFSAEQPIYLYFEVYNLEKNDAGQTDYEVEAVLLPKEDAKGVTRLLKKLVGREKGVSVSLPGQGTASEEGQYLIMDAAGQEPGLYTLVLRVRDRITGRTVEKEKDLFLE